MHRFLFQRFVTVFFLVFLMTAIIFALVAVSTEGIGRVFSVEKVEPFENVRERSRYDLDSSPGQQYFVWLGQVLQGNFGTVGGTQTSGFPLEEILWRRLQVSLSLIITSLIFAVFVGLFVGIYSSLKPKSLWARLFNGFTILGVSIPDFAIGVLLLIVFSVHLRWLPSSGFQGFTMDLSGMEIILDRIKHLILPVLTLSMGYIATFSEHVKTSVDLVMREDFIRTARSKGLSENVVVFKHALRNSLIPILATVFSSLPFFIGGIVIVENLFSWPGLGSFVYQNVVGRGGDFYAVLIIIGLTSMVSLIGSLIADFLYALVDPRVRNPVGQKSKRLSLGDLGILFLVCLGGAILYNAYLQPVYRYLQDTSFVFFGLILAFLLIGLFHSFQQKRSPDKKRKRESFRLTLELPSISKITVRLRGVLKSLIKPQILFGIIIISLVIAGHVYFVFNGYEEIVDIPTDVFNRLQAPSSENVLGTDQMGRPVLTKVFVSARDTLELVFYVTLLGVFGGGIIGIITGFFGGAMDRIINSVFDLISSIPSFFFVFLVLGATGGGEASVIMATAVFGLIELTKVVRARMLSMREFQFVEAAKALGNSELQVLARHLLRNVFPLIWGQSIILFGRNMIILSSLGYLRVLSVETWGYLAGSAVRTSLYSWWMSLGPILMIIIVVLAVNLAGKGVLTSLDPLKK